MGASLRTSARWVGRERHGQACAAKHSYARRHTPPRTAYWCGVGALCYVRQRNTHRTVRHADRTRRRLAVHGIMEFPARGRPKAPPHRTTGTNGTSSQAGTPETATTEPAATTPDPARATTDTSTATLDPSTAPPDTAAVAADTSAKTPDTSTAPTDPATAPPEPLGATAEPFSRVLPQRKPTPKDRQRDSARATRSAERHRAAGRVPDEIGRGSTALLQGGGVKEPAETESVWVG